MTATEFTAEVAETTPVSSTYTWHVRAYNDPEREYDDGSKGLAFVSAHGVGPKGGWLTGPGFKTRELWNEYIEALCKARDVAFPPDLPTQLDEAGWPSVADDAREGISPETILNRLHTIGEGESDAADIVAGFC